MANPDGGRFRSWQLVAAAGALDSLRRQGKGWDRLSDETRRSLAPIVVFARHAVETENTPEAELLAAIPLLARDAAERTADLKRLVALLQPTRPARAQSAALTALARSGDPSVPPALLGAWPQAGPGLRASIIATLNSRPAWQTDLLTALETGAIPPGQIDAPLRHRLVEHADTAIRTRAAKVFAGSLNPDRQKLIAQYEPALALRGDRAKGKQVFAKTCAPCHLLDGVGSAVGPDLAALANKSPAYLLAEILDPSRNLDSRYVEYQADTAEGRTVVGVLASESATAITLRGQQGKDETILRTNLDRLRGTSKSLMPDGLEKDLPPAAMADLLAYLTTADPPHRQLPGNLPAEVTAADGRLILPAVSAFLYGQQITFEGEFCNIGWWSGPQDHAVWKVQLPAAAAFDVYLDYSCAADSAGNHYVLEGADPALRGVVAGTGGWDQYVLIKLGTVKLPAGAGRISVRPEGLIRGALLDLRTIYLVPVGATPKQPQKPKTPAEAAKLILDDATPRGRREELVRDFLPHAAAILRAMTADIPDAKEEYRRIPWIWRVSIAAGRKAETDLVAALLDAALPKPGEPLRDWQAVVIGGGLINGLSLEGQWPGRRIDELNQKDPERAKRWRHALEQAHAMADAEKVPTGTRYDALRMVALDRWDAAGPRLMKYLAKAAHAELQQGAVSGLVDVEHAGAAAALVKALPDLTAGNRKFAVAGLLRTSGRAIALLDAIDSGAAKPDWLTPDQLAGLIKHPDAAVRARAVQVLNR